jgi:hypothetical protein
MLWAMLNAIHVLSCTPANLWSKDHQRWSSKHFSIT